MSRTKPMHELLKVCSVLPVFVVAPAMANVPMPVDGLLSDVNVSNQTGTTLYNLGGLGADLTISNSSFSSVVSDGNGAIAWATGGKSLTVNTVDFIDNVAEGIGGAIGVGTTGKEIKVTGANFVRNHAYTDGGAIGSYAGLIVAESVFDGNTAQYQADEKGEYTKVTVDTTPLGGGAIALGAVSDTTIASISTTTFKNNKSGSTGGAIGTRLSTDAENHAAKLDIAATFENNFANIHGGAIYNTFYANNGLNKGDGVTVTGVFEDNVAGKNGGAIYNDGIKDLLGNNGGVMTISKAKFEENNAGVDGGAIYNTGTLVITDSSFVENKSKGWGGAIHNSGQNDNKVAAVGDLTIKNTIFTDNNAKYAGALSAGTTSGTTNIEKTTFSYNTADEIGAVGLFANSTLKNVSFIRNTATSSAADSDGAGALFVGAVSTTDINGVLSNSLFEANKSEARGGAISTRSFELGDNSAAVFDINKTVFKQNVAATNGGAIDNFFYHSNANADAMFISNSRFEYNTADKGAGIYNHGSESKQNKDLNQVAAIELNSVSFTGNAAITAGGAIYNEKDATVFLSGTNTFTGNKAAKKANDIFNDGSVKIVTGETTIDGGINGAGDLNVADGAVLNIGSATVDQATVTVEGTLMAKLLNSDNYGRVLGDIITGTNNMLKLSVGAAGSYEMFTDADAKFNIDAGSIYDVVQNGTKIVVSTKSATDVATGAKVSVNTANTLIALANHQNSKMHELSLAAQAELNNGNNTFVEKEIGKLNPGTMPVSQSVTTGIQNQVLALTSGRMAGGPTIGRSGGDVTASYGAWAQGLVNKSKHSDLFDADTRGIAVGFDALVNRIYTLGVGYAFNKTEIDAYDRDTDIDSNTLFMYAQYKPAQWYVNGTISYAMAEYTENTNVLGMPFSTDYDVNSLGAQIATGYDFALGITPEVGLRYLHVAQDSYNNGFGKIKADDVNFLSGVAGLKYAFTVDSGSSVKWRPELRAAATYDFVSDESVATIVIPGANSYAISADRLSRMGGEFGIGLTAEYKGLEISVNYELDLHKDYTSQTGLLKLRCEF